MDIKSKLSEFSERLKMLKYEKSKKRMANDLLFADTPLASPEFHKWRKELEKFTRENCENIDSQELRSLLKKEKFDFRDVDLAIGLLEFLIGQEL